MATMNGGKMVKGRRPFHHYLVVHWPPPRYKNEEFIHNFGSDKYEIVVEFMGDYYAAYFRGNEGMPPNERWGILEAASIDGVCQEAEAFMESRLEDEGKDPRTYLSESWRWLSMIGTGRCSFCVPQPCQSAVLPDPMSVFGSNVVVRVRRVDAPREMEGG